MNIRNLSNIRVFKETIIDLFRRGQTDIDDIAFELANSSVYKLPSHLYNNKILVEESLKFEIQSEIDTFESKNKIIQIYKNKLIRPENDSKYIIYDSKKDILLEEMTEASVKDIVKGENYKKLIIYGKSCGYNPNIAERFYTDNGKEYVNTYKPPEWKLKYFKTGIKEQVDIPEIYTIFLKHLTDNREADINYILDWLAISIQKRNFTYLVTVGSGGIGKGVLGKIMERIHGNSNYVELLGSTVKKQFNKQMYGKTLIYFNEIFDISGETSEKIKVLNEEYAEIEKKGVDAEVLRSYANYYFSSNKYDSIQVDEHQRRFSFVDLTDKNFDFNTMGGAELLKQDNVNLFAQYLFTRKYNPDYETKPYKSETSKFMTGVKLKDWQVYMKEEFTAKYKGKTIILKDLLSHLKSIPYRVSGAELSPFLRELPSMFKLSNGNPKEMTLFFNKIKGELTSNPLDLNSDALSTSYILVK